jgi:hypothetical protein
MKRKLMLAALVSVFLLGGYTGAAGAATTTKPVVESQLRDGYDTFNSDGTAKHPNLWFREDTRTGGAVALTRTDRDDEPCQPTEAAPAEFTYGEQSLALTTINSGAAKAQLINHSDEVTGTSLATVNELSYWTMQCAGNGPVEADPSYQLQIDYNGAADGGFANLVFEPYWNDSATEQDHPSNPDQPIAPGVWQQWQATEGNWWSSRQITCGEFSLAPGAGGPPFTTPAAVGAACPDAVVVGIGVNVGSGNPNYVVATDGLTFGTTDGTTTWDFGPAPK